MYIYIYSFTQWTVVRATIAISARINFMGMYQICLGTKESSPVPTSVTLKIIFFLLKIYYVHTYYKIILHITNA